MCEAARHDISVVGLKETRGGCANGACSCCVESLVLWEGVRWAIRGGISRAKETMRGNSTPSADHVDERLMVVRFKISGKMSGAVNMVAACKHTH